MVSRVRLQAAIRTAGWRHPRLASRALQVIVAFTPDLVGGGRIAAHIVALDAELSAVTPPAGFRQRHAAAMLCFAQWLEAHEALLISMLGQRWVEKPKPKHPLHGRGLSFAPIWAALLHTPSAYPQLRSLTAIAVVAAVGLADNHTARIAFWNARRARDLRSVVGDSHPALKAAGWGLRTLFQSGGILEVGDQCRQIQSQTGSPDARARKRIAIATSAIHYLMERARGRRIRRLRRPPRSASEKHGVELVSGRGPSRGRQLSIVRDASHHRTGVIRIARSRLSSAEMTELDMHPDEAASDRVELVHVGCDSDKITLRQLRQARGARNAAARAGVGLRWSTSDLTPAQLDRLFGAIRRPLNVLDDERARLAIGHAYLLGRPVEEILGMRYLDASAPLVESTVAIVRVDGVPKIRVAVPQPTYVTVLTEQAQQACIPVSDWIELPDAAGFGDRALRIGTIGVGDRVFEGCTLQDCDDVFAAICASTSLLESARLSRIADPLFNALLHQTGRPIRARLITGSDRHGSSVRAHYTTLPADLLVADYLASVPLLGVIEANRTPVGTPTAYVGNPRCPKPAELRRLFDDLRRAYMRARDANVPNIITLHNAYTRYAAAVCVLALAFRAVSDPSPSEIDALSRLALWSDKGDQDYQARVGVLARSVLHLLQAFGHHRDRMLERFPLLAAQGPLPFFFLLQNTGSAVAFGPGDFPGPDATYPLDLRSLRRAMCSHLDAAGVPEQVLEAVMAHVNLGRESWAQFSSLMVSDLRGITDAVIAPFLDSLGIEVLPPPNWFAAS